MRNSKNSTSKGANPGGKTKASVPQNDPASAALLGRAGALGNQQLVEELNRKKGPQEISFEFIASRLKAVEAAQLAELSSLKRRNEWFIPVHKGVEQLPEPGRWCEVARLYKRALQLCAKGDLGVAMLALEDAWEAERATLREAPKMVLSKLPSKEPPPIPRPLAILASDATAPGVPIPASAEIANRIENRSPDVANASTRRKRLHNWWEVEEEEDENDNKGESEE